MELTIEYLEDEAIVFVKVSGIMDFEEHRKYAEKTLSSAKQHNTHKIFVDMLDMIPQLSAFETDEIVSTLIEFGTTSEHRFAVLHNPPPPLDTGFEFFIDSAAAELLQVRPFKTREDALSWLKSEPAPLDKEKTCQH